MLGALTVQRFVRWIFQSVHQGEPASFVVTGSPDQAARTLAASMPRRRLFGLRDDVVGSVSTTRVVIGRNWLFVPGFAPHFRGQFVTRNGHTHLEGRFQLYLPPRVFMTIWFGFFAVFCLGIIGLTLVALVTSPVAAWRVLLSGAGFLAVGLAFMALAAWWVRSMFRMYGWRAEVEQITTHIRQALRKRV